MEAAKDVAQEGLSPEVAAELGFMQWLKEECGYLSPRPLGDARWAAVRPLMYTHAIITGRMGDRTGYEDRWCYPTRAQALAAIEAWDGQGDPPVGWIRNPSTGRRRTDGDPSREYEAF